jgi:hypothetical protein
VAIALAGCTPSSSGTKLPSSPAPGSAVTSDSPSGPSSPARRELHDSDRISRSACRAVDLSARVVGGNGGGGHGVLIIAITNRGAPCSVRGYPGLQARGGRLSRSVAVDVHREAIVVAHGSPFGYSEGRPRTLALDRGARVYFALGSVNGYSTPLAVITHLDITVMGAEVSAKPARLSTRIRIILNGPPGRPLPLTTTALLPSEPRPSQ